MAKTKYICIDDKPDEVELSLRRLSQSVSNLDIHCEHPIAIKAAIRRFRALQRENKIHGLILDLRLNDSARDGEIPVEYQAPQLASALRTEMAAKKLGDFPIVLWSIDANFAKSFERDFLSHDLFDYIVHKETLDQVRKETAQILVSLAHGYQAIGKVAKSSSFWRNVLLPPIETDLDIRIGESLSQNLRACSIHLIAQYILKKIVETSGPLVDIDILSARLGITKSSFESSGLRNEIDEVAKYRGPFCDGSPRWWWNAVEVWWIKNISKDPSILSIKAEERVRLLSDRLKKIKGLRSAKPISEEYGTRFTTICQTLRFPLDPIDGFLLSEPSLEAWQDRKYVSRRVAINPSENLLKQQIAPAELERVQALRKIARNAKKAKK